MGSPRLFAGAVVLRDRRRAVVLETGGERALLAPLLPAPCPLLRGDVSIDALDPVLTGISGADLIVRCGTPIEAPTAGQVVIGQVSPDLVERLRTECARAARAAEVERHAGKRLRTGH